MNKKSKHPKYKCIKHRSNDGYWDEDENGKRIWICWICHYSEPFNRPKGKILQDIEYGDYYIRVIDSGANHGTYIQAFYKKEICYESSYGDLSQSMRRMESIRDKLKSGTPLGNERGDTYVSMMFRSFNLSNLNIDSRMQHNPKELSNRSIQGCDINMVNIDQCAVNNSTIRNCRAMNTTFTGCTLINVTKLNCTVRDCDVRR